MDYLDDFIRGRQCDEAYPWGDIAPFDWPEENEFEPGRYYWDEMEANS